jgi:hypothetical protein
MAEQSYDIRFSAIEIISKSILEPPSGFKDSVNVFFNFYIDLKLIPEKEVAIVVTDAGVVWSGENIELARFKVLCAFGVQNFGSVFKKLNNKKYDVPVELEVILKSAGLSTMRGVIAAEVVGTHLQGAVLPLIDVNSIVREQRNKKPANQ